ncbi:hypothetical protein CYMTET_29308 [Cymbomonas tetramitiformis]|uniref:Protein kinase domain-containing protein n=1 Tax=Cymbomonas tetramitiformis TaxID=36881 RepID=A0AAE0FMR9_9CHLO|nr:hypothetical protein CYMTET_29308 [Cymbomonas tetramitiformis]
MSYQITARSSDHPSWGYRRKFLDAQISKPFWIRLKTVPHSQCSRGRDAALRSCRASSNSDDMEDSSRKANNKRGDTPIVLALAMLGGLAQQPTTESSVTKALKRLEIKKLERVGLGSVGEVHRAQRKSSKGGVYELAIKTLNDDAAEHKQNHSKFKDEIEIWEGLQHPNIVRVLHACTRPALLLVLEYCQEGNLFTKLRERPKAEIDTRSLAIGVAEGLAYLHAEEIVHGDIKSANILLSGKATAIVPKLCDFGSAGLVKSKQKQNRVLGAMQSVGDLLSSDSLNVPAGTLLWMAPELLVPSPDYEMDPASDVYAFGMLLYEMVTRELPWTYGGKKPPQTREEMTQLVVEQRLQPELPDSVHPKIAEILVDCWEADPCDRPSMAEVLSRLQDTPSLDDLSDSEDESGSEDASHPHPFDYVI